MSQPTESYHRYNPLDCNRYFLFSQKRVLLICSETREEACYGDWGVWRIWAGYSVYVSYLLAIGYGKGVQAKPAKKNFFVASKELFKSC